MAGQMLQEQPFSGRAWHQGDRRAPHLASGDWKAPCPAIPSCPQQEASPAWRFSGGCSAPLSPCSGTPLGPESRKGDERACCALILLWFGPALPWMLGESQACTRELHQLPRVLSALLSVQRGWSRSRAQWGWSRSRAAGMEQEQSAAGMEQEQRAARMEQEQSAAQQGWSRSRSKAQQGWSRSRAQHGWSRSRAQRSGDGAGAECSAAGMGPTASTAAAPRPVQLVVHPYSLHSPSHHFH